MYTDQESVDQATEKGSLNVLTWMAMLHPPVYSTDQGVKWALDKGLLNVLKWPKSEREFKPSQHHTDSVAGDGYLEVLE